MQEYTYADFLNTLDETSRRILEAIRNYIAGHYPHISLLTSDRRIKPIMNGCLISVKNLAQGRRSALCIPSAESF